MKKGGNKPDWQGFDSREELHFSWYLDDLKEAGYIDSYGYHADTYLLTDEVIVQAAKQLKTKVSFKPKTLLQDAKYTPDFWIEWTEEAKAEGILFQSFDQLTYPIPVFMGGYLNSVIEIKGDGGFATQQAKMSLQQKMLYYRHRIYVQIVKIPELFEKTFSPSNPEFYLTEKTRKKRKINYKIRTLAEFIEQERKKRKKYVR